MAQKANLTPVDKYESGRREARPGEACPIGSGFDRSGGRQSARANRCATPGRPIVLAGGQDDVQVEWSRRWEVGRRFGQQPRQMVFIFASNFEFSSASMSTTRP